ncbi:MAG: hypothetical protein LBC12_03740 [Nitrososphaerota archaeon]|jgi:hypothetical protein|nr:hypothetical protein [Nitrososphaerota archaeon]
MYNVLVKLKITRKKSLMYSEKSETDRQVFLEALSKIPEEKRSYIDEWGIKKALLREYGRASKGRRVEDTGRG